MTAFWDAPMVVRGCIGIWVFATLLMGFEILSIDAGRRINRSIKMLPLMLILYFALQCIQNINEGDFSIDRATRIELFTARFPVWIMIVLLAFVSVTEFFLMCIRYRWRRRNLTGKSIKDALNSLPAGICCYEGNGHIVLKNTVMEKLYNDLFNEPLLNGITGTQKIYKEAKVLEKRQIVTSGNKFFTLSVDETVSKGRKLFILTASDITEEYGKHRELSQKREAVELLNKKLLAYNKEITMVISQKEILNAKIQIHDTMGGALLAAKRYITGDSAEELKKQIVSELTSGVNYLLSSPDSNRPDLYEKIIETADKLGVKICLTGELIEDSARKNILLTGMHECLTNTIRHAKGDELYVDITENEREIRICYTNNGIKPQKTVSEGGGLSSLRCLVEEIGGSMEISYSEKYELRIILPKEEIYGV